VGGVLGQMGAAFGGMLSNVILALPGVVAALLVIVLGYIVGAVFGWLIEKLLQQLHLDKRLHKVCKSEVCGKIYLAGIAGALVKWYIFVIFLGTGVQLMQLGVLTNFLQRVVEWLPSLLIAVLMILIALLVGDYVRSKVAATGLRSAGLLGNILFVAITVLFGVIALGQIGIDISLLENLILAIVGALSLGLALALGISLGLGLKDEAKKWVKKYSK